MAHNNSYPSPSAAQVGEGAGPFYTSQQAQRLPEEELELTAQLSREIGPANHQVISYAQPQMSYQPMIGPGVAATSRPFINPDGSNGDESSARKKSKVSRACDECRRKKIRCDAESDAQGHEKCSNCSRTQQVCDFSRTPMKRGPSKGYIKELADRVAEMERKVNPHTNPQNTAFASVSPVTNEQVQGQDSFPTRKRTHSSSEYGGKDGWQGRSSAHVQTAYNEMRTTAPAPVAPMSYSGPGNNHVTSTNGTTQALQIPSKTSDSSTSATDFDSRRETKPDITTFSATEENMVFPYLAVFQNTVPLLHISLESAMVFYLAMKNSAPNLCIVFTFAMHLLCSQWMNGRPQFGSFDGDYDGAIQAMTQLSQINLQDASDEIVVFIEQTCAMMLMAINMAGPSGLVNSKIPKRPFWRHLAICAAQTKMFTGSYIRGIKPNTEIYTVGCRAVWACIVADRYHAVGQATDSLMENQITFIQPDRVLLGDSFYVLVRITECLTHMSQLVSCPLSEYALRAPTFLHMARFDLNIVDQAFGNQIAASSFLQAAYDHAALLLRRGSLNPTHPETIDLHVAVQKLLSALSDPILGEDYFPFSYHCVALAAKTLADLRGYPGVLTAATVHNLQKAVKKNNLLRGTDQWGRAIGDVISGEVLAVSGNLQQLANTAVGVANAAPTVDFRLVIVDGYLTSCL
ncbi:Glucose-responsive transcription factor [Lambiella insularis]|nr:Glucose-responsive transcription factor [Lambiella insularis]